MTNPLSKVDINTVPRDVNHLEKIGRWQARNLATELGLLGDDASKAAFMQMDMRAMATAILEALKAYDDGKGQTAVVQSAPAQQAPAQQVIPQTQTAAPTEVKRTPRNFGKNGAAAPAQAAPAQVPAIPTNGQSPSNGSMDMTTVLAHLQSIETLLVAQGKLIETQGKKISELEEKVAHTLKLTAVVLATDLLAAETILSSTMENICEQSMGNAEPIVTAVLSGKV